jgi:hypothetical protein
VNSFVVHCRELEELGLKIPTHLAFKIGIGKFLVQSAIAAREKKAQPQLPTQQRPDPVHSHWRSKLKRKCIECGFLQRWYCPACGHQWMCRELCYHAVHERLKSERRG